MNRRLGLLAVVLLVFLVAAAPAMVAAAGNGNQQPNQHANERASQHERGGPPQTVHVKADKTPPGQTDKTPPGKPPTIPSGNAHFVLNGIISGLGSDLVMVTVHQGNRFVKSDIGDTVTVHVSTSTVYRSFSPEGSTPIEFGDLVVGRVVRIQGTISDGTLTALQVWMGVPLSVKIES